MISPLINKSEIFDLAKGKSVIQGMLESGYTIYLEAPGDPSVEETELGLDFYGKFVHDKYIDIIKNRHPDQDIYVMGYCMGGTLFMPYIARRAEERLSRGEAMDIKKAV
ncbi:polyhydroxyalkanoate synthase [Candidatus Magnetoovum chiemensis]|nr:polyhydroxyalkanoate synthase [Candidatus Magnetoovum chiemensis]